MQLTRRARGILYALVSEFIDTGEPVGSRTLSKKSGLELSPATIRNVLSDLEEAGYLAQPHTSAGRVPTLSAFRLFIDALMRIRELSAPEAERIAGWAEDLKPGTDVTRDAGRMLSELAGTAAIVVRAPSDTRVLRKIRFIPLSPRRMLAVVVFSDERVENTFIDVDERIDERELERLHQMLEDVASGRTLASLRDYLTSEIDRGRDEIEQARGLGVTLLTAAISGAAHEPELLIEGQNKLLENPELEAPQLKGLIAALEDRERLLGLLDHVLVERQVKVVFGEEAPERPAPFGVVGAPFDDGQGRPGGAVAILGPTRMDYPVLVPLVSATARALSQVLGRTDRRDGE